MKLSIVIPCYNEEKNLPYLIIKLEKILQNKLYEVILVNNGSQDKSKELIERFKSKYNNLKSLNIEVNKGYGYGILQGINISSGKLIAWTHSDLQTNPEDILQGIKYFKNDKEKIFVKGIRKGRPFVDNFFTISMSIYSSILLRKNLWDINAQPTIFPFTFFENWENPPNDFSLDLYAYYQAIKLNYSICRFPVKFDRRMFGISNWNINIFARFKFIIRNIKYINNLFINN